MTARVGQIVVVRPHLGSRFTAIVTAVTPTTVAVIDANGNRALVFAFEIVEVLA